MWQKLWDKYEIVAWAVIVVIIVMVCSFLRALFLAWWYDRHPELGLGGLEGTRSGGDPLAPEDPEDNEDKVA